ncbi:SCO family protein [Fluviicola taffensis]|uniref:Electron transport protein SCO1/SenC n=1 Tax=Fluviicola taffensis (strain DSM 16823 / NCIMB 13979 / RW262) TaxID=755732 RepID=F2IJ45_FLUTR|nr:SCO family protein [Fluviicola taffensis]AEA43903.1 electron transport protein SCO1/SenC [Fluviicola taffensis DSM 16823]
MKQIIGLAFILILLVSCKTEKQTKLQALPYFGNYDIEFSETDGVQAVDTIYPKIPDFSYLNQDSLVITSKSMKGKVWIANFFFTSCPSICPPMISQMKRLNILTQDLVSEVQFMSFSIDPNTDQPSVLRAYIKNNGIQTKNWYFFTGNEAKTHRLGVMHFMVHADKDPMAAGGFAHSDGMVLVDREGYVRGIYRGTQTKDVDQLNNDLRKLLDIEYGINTKH